MVTKDVANTIYIKDILKIIVEKLNNSRDMYSYYVTIAPDLLPQIGVTQKDKSISFNESTIFDEVTLINILLMDYNLRVIREMPVSTLTPFSSATPHYGLLMLTIDYYN